MTDQQKDTEEQIFEAACRVFQRKGYAGSRMQEIADEADINKSMLHYYYRSKDKLFKKVYQQQMRTFFPIVFDVLDSEMPLDEKVEQLIETYYQFLRENPRMAQFIIQEMNQHPERLSKFIQQEEIHPPKRFSKQVERAIEKGKLDPIAPAHLLVSIISLILFPFIAGKLIQNILSLDKQDFEQFLEQRKSFLLTFILNGINYQSS